MVWALLVPPVRRHCRQSPGFGLAASDVMTIGLLAVPTACSAPCLSVKLAPAAMRTCTPGWMVSVALLSRTTSPCRT